MVTAAADRVSLESIRVTDTAPPSRREVWRMFDRIAHRYDLLNHLLSLNRDKAWRKRLVNSLPHRSGLRVLDLATGTADQLLALYDSGKVVDGIGVDPSEKMLEVGRAKIARRNLTDCLALKRGNGEEIPSDDDQYDAVTISFGIRNVTDVPHTLAEMHRILKPGGRALILEFSLPANSLMRWCYLVYFRRVLPFVGGLISGDSYAYRYLNQTVETFPHGEEFCDLLRGAGFEKVYATPLTFGIASIYSGEK